MMKYERLWERLTEYLEEWASTREVPGGIEVTFEQTPGTWRVVELVISPVDWDDYITSIYGDGDPRATSLKDKIFAMPEATPYLVYDNYGWDASQTPHVPNDDSMPGSGGWVAEWKQAGVSRFSDFDESR